MLVSKYCYVLEYNILNKCQFYSTNMSRETHKFDLSSFLRNWNSSNYLKNNLDNITGTEMEEQDRGTLVFLLSF